MSSRPGHLPWQRAIEPWYIAFGLLAATSSGIAVILLPLAVEELEGNALHVGLVMSMIGLGMATAPIWGRLADRFRWHRAIGCGGGLAVAAGMLGFGFVDSLPAWIGLALLSGTGVGAAFTVANLFIVEVYPHNEWDERISWLQTFNTAGTVLGLALAGLFGHLPYEIGLLVGVVVAAIAAVAIWFTTRAPARPTPVAPGPMNPPDQAGPAPRGGRRGRVSVLLLGPFGLFVAVWFVSLTGMSAVQSFYPLLMEKDFGIEAGPASMGLAAATALSLLVYGPTGYLAGRFGAARVLQLALLIRLAGLVALAVLGPGLFPGLEGTAVFAFGIVTLAWPLLSVSSTLLAPALITGNEGAAMGLYNAAGALAGLAGPLVASWAAHSGGYDDVWLAGAVCLALAVVIDYFLRVPRSAAESVRSGAG